MKRASSSGRTRINPLVKMAFPADPGVGVRRAIITLSALERPAPGHRLICVNASLAVRF